MDSNTVKSIPFLEINVNGYCDVVIGFFLIVVFKQVLYERQIALVFSCNNRGDRNLLIYVC